jgi:peptide/nickel transport system substrate-binding protein
MNSPSHRAILWPGAPVAILALLVAWCAPPTPQAMAQAAKTQLVIDLASEPSSLDPQQQWNPDSYYVYRNIFDNLVTRDDAGQIVAEIATSWKNLSDTKVEFQLRSDVTFHDGAPLTPEDVVYSVRRITDPTFASPQRDQFGKIVSTEATGPHSVVLTLASPYPALLAQLVKLSIVPKHVIEKIGNDAFNLSPIGSGPYKFVSWQRGVAVTLARNDNYWGRKGVFGAALFRAVPDGATRLADIEAGTSDIARALNTDQAAQLEASGKGKRIVTLTERVAYLRLNPNKPPFDNIKYRQALAYAVDKQGITDGLLGGFDKPVDQMVTPAHFGWSDKIKGLSYNPDAAKTLLKQAGVPPRFTFTTAPFFDQRVVQAVQQQLTEVGFNVAISLVDTPTFLKYIQQGPQNSVALAIVTNSCACQDADGALYPLFHSGSSWSIIDEKPIDALLDEARSTLDAEKRLADYQSVSETIARDIPVLPLYQMAATYGAAKQLVWTPTPNESFFLNRMGWSK